MSEDLERSVTSVMDEQIARVTDITRRQDQAISAIADRMMEWDRQMKKWTDGRRDPDPRGGPSAGQQIKVFCPKFNGNNPEGWIFLIEEYFAYHGISEASKVRIACLHMEAEALDWIRRLKLNNMISSWEKLLEDLRERFGDSEFEDSLSDLTRIQQKGSVAAYIGDFERLLNKVTGQTEWAIITFFVGGLRNDLKKDLRIAKPSSLKQAFSLAKVYESSQSDVGGRHWSVNKPHYQPNMTNTSEPILKTPSLPPASTANPNPSWISETTIL